MLPLRFLLPVLLFDSVYVLSRPLKADFVAPGQHDYLPDVPAPETTPPDPKYWTSGRSNREIINNAVVLANQMLRKMMQVIDTPKDVGHPEMITAAFGSHANIRIIKEKIEELIRATIRIRESKASNGRNLGQTMWIRPPANAGGEDEEQAKVSDDDRVLDRILFSWIFFDVLRDEHRAGCVIHEAAHYVNRATDDVVGLGAKGETVTGIEMHPFGATTPVGAILRENYAYHVMPTDSPLKYPTTVDQVDSDPHWKDLTKSAHNMEESAEAYRVFAHLCEHEHDAKPEK